MMKNVVAVTNIVQPDSFAICAASPFGMLPVPGNPRYQAPMSVNWPFWVNMAAFGPTFDTSDRKEPK